MVIAQFFALAFLCCLPALALAQPRPVCPGPITLAFYESGSLYEAASNTGIDKDVADQLSTRSGCRFAVSVKPRARIWHEIEGGELMMTVSGIPTPQRDLFAWNVQYMALKNYVLVSKSLNIHSAAEFAARPALQWGVVRSYKHGAKADEFLNKLRQRERVKEEADLESVIRVFALPNRTHAVMAQVPAYLKYVQRHNIASQIYIEDWFPEDPPVPLGMVFSKKHFAEPEIKKWRLILGKMRTDGTLKAIYTKHLGAVEADRMLQFSAD